MYPNTLFSIFGPDVTLYSLCMAAGIICCFLFLWVTLKKAGFNNDARDIILCTGLLAVPVGIFFAMLFQSIYDYLDDPTAAFRLTGKMTFLGGLIGGAAAYLLFYNLYMYVIAPRTKIRWLKNNANAGLCDALPVIPIGISLAHAFGRLGCFFAGCCSGEPSDAWFAIACSETYPGVRVVPVQLFECLFLLVLSGVMAFLWFRFRCGYNLSVYSIGYGVWRFCIEFLRGDARGSFVGTLSPSQFWSLILIVCGIAYIFLYRFALRKKCRLLTQEQRSP